MPASVASYTFSISWKVARSVSANGVAVANLSSANARGVSEDVAKLMSEKVCVPDVTSGTPERVVTAVLQVTEDSMAVSTSMTSWGSTVEPITKQGVSRIERGAGLVSDVVLGLRERTNRL